MKKMVAVVLSAGVVLVASSALGCMNSMKERAKPKGSDLVASAASAFLDGRFADAATTAGKALDDSNEATRATALRLHGVASLHLGKYDDAVHSLAKLSALRDEPYVQVKLAEAKLRGAEAGGSLDRGALGSLEKLAKNGFLSDADAWTALARARLRAGDPAGARAACDAALKVVPGHPEATQLESTIEVPKPPAAPVPVKGSTKS